jgi:hypothetical protein
MTGFYKRLLFVCGLAILAAGCDSYKNKPNGNCDNNGVCDRQETSKSCPGDCRSASWECGNGVCESGETEETCGADCLSSEQGCGNGSCETNETAANCPADCTGEGATCGNGVCEAGETVETCPNDCSTVPFFDGACKEGDQRDECALDDDADGAFSGNGLVGSSAAIVGDLDGDGLADIVIGAPRDDQGGEEAGAVYLLYGRDMAFDRQLPLRHADAAFIGRKGWDQFGSSVASAGDFNGDGFADFLVGAPAGDYELGDYAGPGQGSVYLITGSSMRWSGTNDNHHASGGGSIVRFVDSQTVGSAGMSVAGVGDVDGDGYDDFVVGAPLRAQPGQNSSGAVYLVYGQTVWDIPPGPVGSLWLDDVSAGWVNDVDDTILGVAVAGAGDVNGDGYADILIGAGGNGNDTVGRAYLVYGRSARFTGLGNISDTDAMFISGEDSSSTVGYSLAGLGDLDSDGYDDVIIGNPDLGGNDVAYLYYGRAEAFNATQDISAADTVFKGETISFLGPNLASAGDVNGDGYRDLAIGAGYMGVDAVYVFLGGAKRLQDTLQLSGANTVFFVEPDENDSCRGWVGSVVAGGGDVNGDGLGDFLVGAMGHCFGDDVQGNVYLVLGVGL